MRLQIFVEPQQGATYDDQLAVARCAEEEGFDAFFRSDHYVKMGGGDGLPGPTDAWTTLAGLARETASIRLGTLVTSATFRLAGPAGHHRGPGRRHERRPGGTRPRGRLVRGRAPRLRHFLPTDEGALRSPRGATRRSSPVSGKRLSARHSASTAASTR